MSIENVADPCATVVDIAQYRARKGLPAAAAAALQPLARTTLAVPALGDDFDIEAGEAERFLQSTCGQYQLRSPLAREALVSLVLTPYTTSSVTEACHRIGAILEMLLASRETHAERLMDKAIAGGRLNFEAEIEARS